MAVLGLACVAALVIACGGGDDDSGGSDPTKQDLTVAVASYDLAAGKETRFIAGLLTIDDQGPGVAEADRPHVFERFWRSEESRSMPGSGLGLAIVRQVVDRHGGRVAVVDAPSGGARFMLWIPAVEAIEEDVAPAGERGAVDVLESPDVR